MQYGIHAMYYTLAIGTVKFVVDLNIGVGELDFASLNLTFVLCIIHTVMMHSNDA